MKEHVGLTGPKPAGDERSFRDAIPANRRAVWDYYGLVGIDDDGYPLSTAKMDRTRVVAHPMHGSYLIHEYVNEYIRNQADRTFLEKAVELAKASINRMTRVDDTLRFLYVPDDGMTSHGFEFYSALTQGHYLLAFSRLRQWVDDPFLAEANEAVFRSLLVPVAQGGVLLETNDGPVLEEYPTEVPSLVLNGWLTVLNEIFEYGYLTGSQEAIEFAGRSARALIARLHLYDVPEVWNSRYKLSGHVPNRVVFKGGVPTIRLFTIDTGGQVLRKTLSEGGRHQPLDVGNAPSEAKNILSFKTILTMANYPDTSRIALELEVDRPTRAQWSVGLPQHNPKGSTPRIIGLRQVAEFQLAPGASTITAEMPLDLLVQWTGAPVPFSKKISGKHYNVYHYLHIKAMSQLNAFYPSAELLKWRDKWLEYTKHWAEFPAYAGEDVAHSVVDRGRFETQDEYLRTPRTRVPRRLT